MSDQDTWHREREVTLVISDVVVKGYHECLFSVDIGDKFVARKKRGDRGKTQIYWISVSESKILKAASISESCSFVSVCY